MPNEPTEKHVLQLLLEDTDYAENMRSYSGRGMSGQTCLGVTGSSLGDFMSAVMGAFVQRCSDSPEAEGGEGVVVSEATLDLGNAIAEALGTVRTDNMGRDIIIYFPRVPFVEEDAGGGASEER